MSESPAPNPIPTPNTFNTDFFFNIGNALTFETANKYFLSLNGGNITYLNVLGTLSINGSAIDLSLISGVVAGTPQNSKALSLDSSGKINGALTLTGTITSLVSIATTMTCNGVDVGSNIAPLVGITLGTPAASKALTLNASSQIAGSLTLTGNLTATNLTGTLQTAAQPNITSLGTLSSLIVSGLSYTSNTRMTTTTNYNGVMDTASLILKQASVTNGNKIGLDFMISTNDIDAVNTATCSIVHERLSAYVGDLIFLTKRTANATNPLTEALRISSTGTCSIANTSSGYQLDLGASGTGISTNALTTTSLTLSGTTASTSNTTGALTLSGGIGISLTTDATSITNGGTFTSAGGGAFAKSLYVGTTLTATTLTGLLSVASASQTNITSVGTLASLNYTGLITGGTVSSAARLLIYGSTSVNNSEGSTNTFQINASTNGSFDKSSLYMGADATLNYGWIQSSRSGVNSPITINGRGGTVAINTNSPNTSYTFHVNGLTLLSNTTGSTSNTTGALTLTGGIGISLTTDSSSITNGGTFTTAGGMAIAKSLWCGGTIYVNRSISGGMFSGYCGTSNLTISGLLNSDITIQTAGTTNLNIGTGSTTAMTIDGINQSIYGISSLTATNLSATNLYGTITTASQPNIATVDALDITTHDGATVGLKLGGTLVTATAAELNYCDLAGSAGTAEANKVMTLDASKNIATLNILTSNYLTANLAINSPNAIASFGAVNIGPIVTAYGISSIKGSVGYSSAFFGSTNSILWMEGSNPSVIEAEINISSGPGSTPTNGMRIGTCTANQFSLFTNATNRLIITSTGNVGIGSNASTNDKVFGILDGTAGSTQVDFRYGNALSSNNCFTMSYIPTSSGSGLNKIQFDPYGTSGALTILAKKYIGIGTTGPICPLDVAGSDSGLGILAPYQVAGNDVASGFYVTSGTTTGVSINARFQSNVIFDDKIYIRSDRRVKKDIIPLTVDLGIKFVNEVDPVLFRKKNQSSDAIMEIGYIAQDIMKAGFGNIITHTDNDKLKVEEEGDIENIQFNVDYSRVCSILHSVVKDQQKRITSLEDTLEDILNELREIKSNQCLDILYH